MRLLPQAAAWMSENSVRPSKNVRPVAHGERPEALVDRPLEGPQDLRRPSLGQIPRDAALEQETQLEDLTHVLRRGLCHPSPSIRLDRDQPVALEPDEGFANGRFGDAELLGDTGLDELRPGLELTGDDVVAQALVDASLELRRNDLLARRLRHASCIVYRAWLDA